MTRALVSRRVPEGTLRHCYRTPNLRYGPLDWLPETSNPRRPESVQIVDSGRFPVSSWRSFPHAWRHYAHRAGAVLRSCAIHIVVWGFVLCVGCWSAPARAQVAADAASATKPNIVIILADDLGWGDVRAMRPESTLATPRIDSIAAAGMRFTDAHSAAAVCSPSRYALLTGRYGWRSYLSSDVLGDRARPLIDSDLPTLGSMLQQHGYRTAAIGKWHLGLRFPRLPPDEENNINRGLDWNGEIEGAPVGFGFDEFFGVSGNLSFHPRAYIRDDRITAYPDQPYTPTGLLPSHFRHVAPDFDPFDVLDRLTEEAVAFIDRSAGQENPFFLYFALTAPHVPLIPESRFVGTSGLGYYGDFVAQIDWIVGQVLDALARAGIADDTLLVFTSDNGSPMDDRPNWLATHHVNDPSATWYWSTVHKPNGDWRGIKSTIHEGGHRVPYLVRWPGVVPAGSETAFTSAHVDLYATLADIVGHRLEDGEAIDSLSILPVLRGEQATPRRSVVNHSAKGMFAVRSGPWKLVLGNGGGGWGGSGFIGTPFTRPYKLYDLSRTPWEGKNLIEEHRARADELEERLSTIRSSTKRSQLYSDDASLGALALSGIEIGEFAGEVWGYSAQVANNVTSTTVTATAADEYATVVISDGKHRTVGTEATVELREGGNTIMVTVTAEDMYTTWTYAVVVSRENAATGDPGFPSASPEITSGSSFTVVEGETAVATLTATDTDTQDSDLIWSLSGGADQAKFIITNSGVLALGAAKDFEAPDDTNTGGVYQVTVQVSDGGRTDTVDLTVTLANLNEAPTANAGEDQTGIGEGATVTLSGSGSDPDANDALTYAWTQTGGPSVPSFDSALAAPTFVAPTDLSSDATLTFTLRVTDEAGLYHEDETTVGMFSSAPLTAVFEGVPAFHDGMRGFDVWLRFNREVKLNSTAFTNGLLTVDSGWVRGADRLISGSTTHWTFTVMPSGDADVVITLPAGRTCGTTGAVCTLDDRPLSAAASATVAGPAAPRVTGSTTLAVPEGETAVATLTASDADTPAMDLQWSIPSSAGGGADRRKFTITAGGALTFVTAKDFEDPDDADTDGSYQVTVQVSDSRRSDKEDLTVTLSNRNEAPTADAGADRQDIEQGATVTLAGSGSDPDADDTLTYAWTQTGGTDVTLSDATAPAPSFTAPAGLTEDATLTFSLKVTDKAGLYHEDAVSVRVKARPPRVATIAAAAGTVTEGAAATFTVSLDAPAAAALPVAVSVSETGAALSGSSPATVDFAAGESSKTLSLATTDDQVVEPDSTVTATVSLGAGYTVGTASSAFVRVENEDTATFTVSAAPEAIAEGESATLTVAIANGVTFAEDQTVELAASGTASASDYTGVPATLTLAAGASSVTAGLAASEDQDEEQAETVTITASHNGSPIGSATLTITSVSHDATLGGLSLSGIEIGAFSGAVTSYQGSVGHAVATTTVTAAATHSGATVSIEPGSEVSLAVGANEIAVTVTAEDGTTTKTYTVTVTRAALPEASIAAGASPVTEGTAASFTVTLDQAAPEALTVSVSVTESGSALSGAPPASVAFAKGGTSARLAVPTAGDGVVEADSTVTATVTAGTAYTVGTASSASVTVEDDDAARFTVSADPQAIDEGEASTLTVAIANGVTFAEDQTVELAASGTASASDYTGVPATLTLAAGASSVTAGLAASEDQDEEQAETVTITASHDSSPIGSATVTITSVSHDATLGGLSLSGIEIGTFSGAVTSYQASVGHAVATTTVTATATHSAATVSIEPGSEVSLAVGANEIAVTVTAEDGIATKTYTVTVTRAAAPALPVVSIAAVEERVAGPVGEFTVSRTGPTAEALDVQVLFANSRSSRTQTLTIRFLPGRSSVTTRVQAGDNNLVEDDITVTYTLREGEGYTVSAEHGSASVVVEESDIPEFSVSARPAEIAEGESATVAVAITNGVRFREAQTIDLSVSGTASGSDHTGVPAALTLRAYGTSTKTATLTAELDGEDEAAETVTITASHGGSEIGSATVAIAGSTTPLTGRFAKMPATHDGDTRFGFELHFSEAIRISYRTLRDGAFTVTGGAVREARRLAPPSNLGWEITVEPASDADMVLVLPATTDCAAAGAVCTAAGKRLSGRLTATVRGPATQAAGPGFPLAPENGRPSGIWSDGATAWVADVDDGKLFAYRLSDGSRAPGRDVAVGGSPMGLWSDGGTLWVAELTGGLAAYRLADGSRLPGRDLAPAVSASPVGVWSDGETVWIAEWLGDTVHGYRLSDGERAPARDIRLAAGNLLPVGLWSDGETLWVADWDERMVAYRLSDGERAPERDVAAQGPDADPSGLWSDGETLLATGWAGGEVRAHALPAAAGRAVAAARGGEPGAVPPIGDPALRAAIVAALGAEAGAAGLAGLEVLDARDGGIRSLAGLEGAVDLKELDLGFNPLDDTQALAKLVSLRSLNLDGAAPDLAVLGSLTGLERLSLRHNGVSDLGPLAALAQLGELDVGDNRIEDLRPLMALQALAVLRADRNRIVDLRPLASLPGLERLSLRSNGVSDLGPLAALTQLGELDVGDNRIEDLWPLASLPRLAVVDLAGNRIRDLQPPAAPDLTALGSLPGLERLSLRSSGISDLGPLAALAQLRELDVGDNRIEDLRPLAALRALAVLRADRNRIADLRPLASLPRLAVVDLGRNRIRDLRPLAALDRLRTLRLDGNGISAPGPLAGLAGVRELGLAGNAVGDLGALSGLAGLRRLDLRGNPVTDLGPLRGLPSLGWVHVGASGIADLRPLDGAAELTLAGVDDRETPHGDRHRTRPTPGN